MYHKSLCNLVTLVIQSYHQEFGQFHITYDIRRLDQNSDERSRAPGSTEFVYFLFLYSFKYSVGNPLGHLYRKFVNKKKFYLR